MTTDDGLRADFLATDISVDLGVSGWVSIEDALDLLPTPVHVITAWNPLSVELPEDENLERNECLIEALEQLPVLLLPAVGKGSTSEWAEDSIAVIGLDRRDAIAFGRKFEQHAIFEVTDDDLIVLGCFEEWEEHRLLDRSGPGLIGGDGFDVEGVEPSFVETTREVEAAEESLLTRANLSTAIHQALGFTATSALVRARYLGWDHEGRVGAPCPICHGELDLFGCTSESRSRELVRLMAFACCGCRSILWPHEVSGEVRECAKAWRKLSVACIFPGDQNDRKPYSVYVIELEGEVDERPAGAIAKLPWVYVGQSARTPEERLVQHLEGHRSSRWVRRYGSHLRPDLYAEVPVLTTRVAAMAGEAWMAASLRSRGYPVKGGH